MRLTGMGGNVAFLGVWKGYSHGPVSLSDGSVTLSVTCPPLCWDSLWNVGPQRELFQPQLPSPPHFPGKNQTRHLSGYKPW